VFHVRSSGPTADNPTAAAALAEWIETVYAGLASVLSEHTTFESINILLLATDEALGDFAWPTLTIGGATGDQLPAADCCLSLQRTGFSRHVGRKYWGPFSEANQNDGLWDATVVNACQAAALAASTTFTAANGVNMLGVVLNFALGTGFNVSQVATAGLVRSQRRRNRGIGI
jgi:hypothetical protein